MHEAIVESRPEARLRALFAGTPNPSKVVARSSTDRFS